MKNIMRLRENIFFSSSWFPWRTQPDETAGKMKRTKRQTTTKKKRESERERGRGSTPHRVPRRRVYEVTRAVALFLRACFCLLKLESRLRMELFVARRVPRGTHVSHAHTRVSCCGAPTGRGKRTRGRRFGVRTLSKNITDHDVECEEGRVPTLIHTCRALGRCNRGADRAYVGGSRSRKFEPMHWAL